MCKEQKKATQKTKIINTIIVLTIFSEAAAILILFIHLLLFGLEYSNSSILTSTLFSIALEIAIISKIPMIDRILITMLIKDFINKKWK